ncbi:type II toxin-antitoxin system RelE/ParE family toxin [Jiella sp. M17.18]|uniref:type II toxin-antitoxin system RelE/ParE family toxin n=1 Tax=Jiella sp. M17.18 TaxID=3234247 RepID=UPI0034DEC37A
MKRLVYAPEALADLREIALFIAADNPKRAVSFVAELEKKAAIAARRPSSFRERLGLAPGLRAIVHGRYLIFFWELAEEVRVVRVLHGARNLSVLEDT